MSVPSGPVAAERGPGRAITRPGPCEAHSGPQEPTTGDPRAVRGIHAAAGGPHSASQRLAGSGRRPGAENAPEGRSWLSAYPARPGAPLILPGKTLAEALGALVPATPPLPARLADTLTLLAKGLTNRQIGRRLGISPDAAKHRVQDLYRHLSVHNRAGAVYRAVALGLLDPTGGPR